MENLWKRIKFDDLQEGQFLLITYDNDHQAYMLAEVLKGNKIKEMSTSIYDHINLDSIENGFKLQNYITINKKLIQRKDGIIMMQNPNSKNKIYVLSIIQLDPILIKGMVKKEVEETEKKIKELQQNNRKFKKKMKRSGLLEKQKKEKVIQNNYTKNRFIGKAYGKS